MDKLRIIELVKARAGITSTVRDAYIDAIIDGVLADVKHKGILLDSGDAEHLMFCVDYAYFRYSNKDEAGSMPRHLKYRLHNLYIRARCDSS